MKERNQVIVFKRIYREPTTTSQCLLHKDPGGISCFHTRKSRTSQKQLLSFYQMGNTDKRSDHVAPSSPGPLEFFTLMYPTSTPHRTHKHKNLKRHLEIHKENTSNKKIISDATSARDFCLSSAGP